MQDGSLTGSCDLPRITALPVQKLPGIVCSAKDAVPLQQHYNLCKTSPAADPPVMRAFQVVDGFRFEAYFQWRSRHPPKLSCALWLTVVLGRGSIL